MTVRSLQFQAHMQITCPGCGQQLPVSDYLGGTTIRCGGCNTLVDVPLPSQPVDPAFTTPGNAYGEALISDRAIIVAAVSCLVVLVLVVTTAVVMSVLEEEAPVVAVETTPEETAPIEQRTVFQEGYSMVLPPGFERESREETERGHIVYRFATKEGYRFTLAIIEDESIDQYSSPPREYSRALVKSVKELSEGVEGDIQPERVTVGVMPANVFRYYEKETYRGVTFTYHMVVLDSGRKLVLRFAGKYGRYSEQDENITMPDHWYRALMTLESER